MGMCLALYTLSDANVRRLLADPPLIWKVVAPDDPDAYANARREIRRGGFFSRLFGRKADATEVRVIDDFVLAADEVVETDIDKAWHGLHYLLTGTAWAGEEPLCFLAAGGTEVGNIEVGYGPARVLTAAQVQAWHEAVRGLDGASLRARFAPDEMMKLDIYPAIWDRDPAKDDTFGYCAEHFEALKGFVAEAARRKVGMVLVLT